MTPQIKKTATKKFTVAVSQEYPDSSIFTLLETELKLRTIYYNGGICFYIKILSLECSL